MKNILILSLMTLSAVAFAAGKGGAEHHPSILDLKWPFVNFVILFGFLFLKLRNPLRQQFDKYSSDIKEFYRHAEERIKEANFKYEAAKDKTNNISSYVQRVQDETSQVLKGIEESSKQDAIKELARLRKESADMFESEKSQKMKAIASELVDLVSAKTKASFNQSIKKQEYSRNLNNVI